MAAAKEAVVIVLDVGPSMSRGTRSNSPSHLSSAQKAIELLVQQKMLYNKKDEIGLVLFGTEETSNPMTEEAPGQYEHVFVQQQIETPALQFLKSLRSIKPGPVQADFIDGLVVALDMLHRRIGTKKMKSQVLLITDAAGPAQLDGLEAIADQIKKTETSLNIMGMGFEDPNVDVRLTNRPQKGSASVKKENEAVLRKLAGDVGGYVLSVNEVMEILSELRSSAVGQVTKFRGDLEIGNFRIKVWSYVKTSEKKFPPLKKLSLPAYQGGLLGTHGVKMQRLYRSPTDSSVEVAPQDRVKGYKYGKNLHPMSSLDEVMLKYTAEKCLRVIGFVPAAQVPRHYYMSSVDVFCSEPGDERAALALSALAHALAEKKSVAILRYVWRNNAVPYLGCLIPYIKDQYEVLFYVRLPFAEDIRDFHFPSFTDNKKATSTREQLSAAEDLINALDLTTATVNSDGEPLELLKPKDTFNPILQRFYQYITNKAQNASAPVPPLDPAIARYVNPDEELFAKAKAAIEAFVEKFPTSKTEGEKKRKFRVWKADGEEVEEDEDKNTPGKRARVDEEPAPLSQTDLTLERLLERKEMEVGTVHPVEDFWAMIKFRGQDLVDKAFMQMKRAIETLVEQSVRTASYDKALSCLLALRDACVQQDEPASFNDYLRALPALCDSKRRTDFWDLVKRRGVNLITDAECESSTVSAADAHKFLFGDAGTVQAQQVEPPAQAEEPSLDALLEED